VNMSRLGSLATAMGSRLNILQMTTGQSSHINNLDATPLPSFSLQGVWKALLGRCLKEQPRAGVQLQTRWRHGKAHP
jgi:hypothetical protein